ncbi:methionyl-tRNA formyltransferase [Telmatospirillum sp. J64-1]|uniref:methionyl-tRNA formyltransferase n=1 Tax=Telmatospirillum sp. J64-1 TaxID=2502183 RepID=UPI00163DAFCF|nr:formyltransferase family protein [Telmatospirillum sp. J64-1]
MHEAGRARPAEARPLTIMLVGEGAPAMRLLRSLTDNSRHSLAGVVTGEAVGSGPSLRALARKLDLPVWPSRLVTDPAFAEIVAAAGVDLLLNVHSLLLVRPEVIAAARIGAFNMHPGPLPRYAGLNSVNWALFRGEEQHGVTLHWMDGGIDTGAIAYQTLFDVRPDDTALTVSARCSDLGLGLIQRLIKTAAIEPSSIPRQPTDPVKREYFGREIPQQGRLCWSRPAREVVDFIRACDHGPFPSAWGHPRTRLGGREFAVLRASRTGQPATAAPGTVCGREGSQVTVACDDETILVSHVLFDSRSIVAGELLAPGQCLEDGD